ncbi:hypothetical protein [Sphingopyxis sp.]|uniref:hypothetical protein n=1 Tax=Sphingopyxis sp. TaxID=1908224 RepID=UPI003D80F92A
MAEADPHDPEGFRITDAGLKWAESEFAIGFDGQNHQFRRRRAPSPIEVPTVAFEKWGRSAAIAGWFGVAVMVVGVVVAIFLDYN